MRRIAFAGGVGVVSIFGGCGQSDFDRDPPRPPAVVQVTGVITAEKVTVSPGRIGGGMIVLTVSNQDEDSHTVILEGVRSREQVGPINPQDTATVTAELTPGSYAVRSGSERAVDTSEQIEPARLVVGQGRPTG